MEKMVVKIGVLAPLTGGRADAGEYMRNAPLIAEEEINSDKSKKYIVQLVLEDTQYMPNPAVTGAQKLINIDNVRYIIGPYGSSQVLAVAPVAEENKVILITPGGQADGISDAGDYIFRLIHHASQEAPVFAEFVARKMAGDTLHFIAVNNAFAPSYLGNFLPALERRGKRVGIKESFEPDATDFRTQLLKIKAQNPTDIFPIATPKQMGLILKQANELGIKANFYHIGVEGPELVEVAGALAEGIFYSYSYDSASAEESVRRFYELYNSRFNAGSDTGLPRTHMTACIS